MRQPHAFLVAFAVASSMAASCLPSDVPPPPWDDGVPAGVEADVAAAVALMGSENFDERERGSSLASVLSAELGLRMAKWSAETGDPELSDRLLRAARDVFEARVLPLDQAWSGIRGWLGIGSRMALDRWEGDRERWLALSLIRAALVAATVSGVFSPDPGPEPPRAMSGIIVLDAYPLTPADNAGLRTGDVITEADGSPLKGQRIHGIAPGRTIRLRVFRPEVVGLSHPVGAPGEWLEIDVTAEERPESALDHDALDAARERAWRSWVGVKEESGSKGPEEDGRGFGMGDGEDR
jgi:hypothetical protein